jgi:hypothetical protein
MLDELWASSLDIARRLVEADAGRQDDRKADAG